MVERVPSVLSSRTQRDWISPISVDFFARIPARDRREYVFRTVRLHAPNNSSWVQTVQLPILNHPVGDSAESVAERFEPSSRNFLIGEQPNAWDLLQPRAMVSRHRGAELRRR